METSPSTTPPTNIADEEAEIKRGLRRILRGRDKKRQNLIPILQRVQDELGYLPRQAMLEVARFLNIPDIDVYSVATFYNQFRLTPPGKHSIRVCVGTACYVKGSRIILEAWERRLGIKRGDTTLDREFDLDTVACVGCCAMAPVTVVDETVRGSVEPTTVDGILLSFEREKDKEDQKDS